jgi:hypothetical protein
MQRGGGGSLVAVDGSGEDVGAEDAAGGPVASGCSVDDVDAELLMERRLRMPPPPRDVSKPREGCIR